MPTPTQQEPVRTDLNRSARLLRMAAEINEIVTRLHEMESECTGMGLNFQPACEELFALETRIVDARI